MKYSDTFMNWLEELGYTHCFFVGGGNGMHLLESASRRFECIPVVHEVAAGIAAEYFNETSTDGRRAFVLVTAGPGLTNLVTAIAGSWQESRELLIVGGQAKRSDLSRGTVRQIGHQEIDGVAIVKSICKRAILADRQLQKNEVVELASESWTGRKGPVFIEMCIDVSAEPFIEDPVSASKKPTSNPLISSDDLNQVIELYRQSERPLILLGAGIDRKSFAEILPVLKKLRMPLATTFNGADRVGVDYPYYCGRPHWYGMRWSNIILQQADLVLTIGTRLGIQQTGFSWNEYVPEGKIVQIDIDQLELEKGFPKIELGFACEANDFLKKFIEAVQDVEISNLDIWIEHINLVKALTDKVDEANIAAKNTVELQSFLRKLGDFTDSKDVIIPCSSGGSFTGMMAMFRNITGQLMVTNSSLASMGYGLSGAIGAAIANQQTRTILVEGDGGFAQNLQELGTAVANNCNLKIFVCINKGYASIRTTQKAYFQGNYVGCDRETGLGLPNWEKIFDAYGIPHYSMNAENLFDIEFEKRMRSSDLQAFLVELDPEQLYFPKLTSRVLPSGVMASNPLHLMTPPLDESVASEVFRWIPSK